MEEQKKVEVNLKARERKLNKAYKIVMSSIFAVIFIVGALVFYANLNFEIGYFKDLSMAPTINKTVTNKGEVVEEEDFRNRNDNVVEYGYIVPRKIDTKYQRFDVVVLEDSSDLHSYSFDAYRVVGLPGESILLDFFGNLYVNDVYFNQPIPKEYLKLKWDVGPEAIPDHYGFRANLKENEYYLLKDNRYNTTNDSRIYGGYTIDKIYGKVLAITGTCTISGGSCINRSFPIIRMI